MTVADAWPVVAGAFTLGLAGSVHCLGMCGGIAAAAGTRTQSAGSGAGAALAGLTFNLGRIASYVLLGLAVGAIVGAAVSQIPVRPFAVALRALAGLLMFVMGLSLLTGRDLLSLERAGGRLWGRLRPLAGRALALPPALRFGALGLLWGFLPCGLVYSALALSASSGSMPAGGATMLAFGLGTLPAMLAVTLAGSAFTRRLSSLWTRRVAGVLMIVFAFWTAFGTFAPHGGGHASRHGDTAAAPPTPAHPADAPHRH
jgi:sulfite exporter TauE/SafE